MPCNSSLTLCESFSKVLILFLLDFIYSSSNMIWHLYTWEYRSCLFDNLKRRNFGTKFLLRSKKNLRSKRDFGNLNSRFSNLRILLKSASSYLPLTISTIDFALKHLMRNINGNTKPIILIILPLNNLNRNTFHWIYLRRKMSDSTHCNVDHSTEISL